MHGMPPQRVSGTSSMSNMETLTQITVLLALVGSALMAGLFFIFSTTVMKALSKLEADGGIRAMQSINRVIINPWFLIPFMGTAIISLVIGILVLLDWGANGAPWFLSAACLYLFGTFLCTVVLNVPLNEKLEKIGAGEAAEFWQFYLQRWTRYNHYRTVASLLSVIFYAIGLMHI